MRKQATRVIRKREPKVEAEEVLDEPITERVEIPTVSFQSKHSQLRWFTEQTGSDYAVIKPLLEDIPNDYLRIELMLELVARNTETLSDAFTDAADTKEGVESLLWDRALFRAEEDEVKKEIRTFTQEVEGIEGLAKCTKCGSTKALLRNKQTRGGDEGTTAFFVCTNCGNTWVQR